MINLSDGVKDGFALFYIKNGELHTVLLNETQVTLLDASLSTVFNDENGVKIVKADDVKKYL